MGDDECVINEPQRTSAGRLCFGGPASYCFPECPRVLSGSKQRDGQQKSNRPFYRYGGLIELIRFKEYYRMPRGREHISFVFSSAFREIFS